MPLTLEMDNFGLTAAFLEAVDFFRERAEVLFRFGADFFAEVFRATLFFLAGFFLATFFALTFFPARDFLD